jgi:pilus assembly protein Flp/PilA
VTKLVARFAQDQSGATAIEYCLIAGLISIAIFAGLTTIGPKLNATFTNVSGGLN